MANGHWRLAPGDLDSLTLAARAVAPSEGVNLVTWVLFRACPSQKPRVGCSAVAASVQWVPHRLWGLPAVASSLGQHQRFTVGRLPLRPLTRNSPCDPFRVVAALGIPDKYLRPLRGRPGAELHMIQRAPRHPSWSRSHRTSSLLGPSRSAYARAPRSFIRSKAS